MRLSVGTFSAGNGAKLIGVVQYDGKLRYFPENIYAKMRGFR